MVDVDIKPLAADEAEQRIDQLVDLVRDAVDGGATINFLAGVTDEHLTEFWRSSIAEQRTGARILLVAEADERVVGTTLLIFAPQQNASHRADVGKMLVHSAYRQRGVGRRLLEAVEREALANGRTLLMLDTETGSNGERLYTSTGWTAFGEVPDHSFTPDGQLSPTTFFYKVLGR